MNNQEAIRLIRNLPTMCEFTNAYGEPIDSDAYYEAVELAISALQAQDAKNSKESSSTHKALDTISRQAAINTVKKHYRVDNDLLEVIVYQLENLPSAQPDVPDINVGDMVSRQAAIDALRVAYWDDNIQSAKDDPCIVDAMTDWAIRQVKALPSAQPETAKRIVGKSRNGMTLWYQCDMCNEPVDAQDDFCRGCGRRLTDG